ncbi:MAG: T9SS type A sorting domain-containing protein [Lewinellaceae bacterium]|nr:T9SS type A sorting domain-containing protein [Lewinellaceae bacterium]
MKKTTYLGIRYFSSVSILFLLIFLIGTLKANNGVHPAKPKTDSPSSTENVVCEITCSGDMTMNLNPGECSIVVNYSVTTTGDCMNAIPVQTEGLPSGAQFPIGVTHNTFNLDLPPLGSPDGDISCSFDVTVNEFAFPTNQLNCNGFIQVSLDQNCGACVTAAEVLQGGPYHCYDYYTTQFDKVPPFGDGPWVSACATAADVGKEYAVRALDPVTQNFCYGTISIQDKLKPTIQCNPITILCNQDPNLNAEPAPGYSGNEQICFDNLSDVIGESGPPTPDVKSYDFDFSYLPSGAIVQDVNCRIKLTGHAWLPDLSIQVTAPDGTTADLFSTSGCTGAVFNIDVLFDDEGSDINNDCFNLNVNGAPTQCLVSPGVSDATILAVFDGSSASGIWTVTITDDSDGDAGLIEIVCLDILVDVPQSIAFDNCSGLPVLNYVDTENAEDCMSGFTKTINRLWKATDGSGNTSTCVQLIKVLRPTFDDLEWPQNYNGVDAPVFQCMQNEIPTPDWIEGQGLQGWPTLFGLPGSCGDITWDYQDENVVVCQGIYNVLRKWTAVNWCTFEMITHDQQIKVVDDQDPEFLDLTSTIDIPDQTLNDPELWNNVFNPSLPATDLTEVEADLSMTTTDGCSGNQTAIDYQLELDLDGDGQVETTVNSKTLGTLGWNNVMYNNVSGMGTPREFDNRPVPVNEKWGFAIQRVQIGDNVIGYVKFNTQSAPNVYVTPQLPQGNHKIKWFNSDLCGNNTTLTQDVNIQEGITSGVFNPGSDQFVLFQNTPNPFDKTTTITFRLPESAEARLTVFDAQGRVLFSKTAEYAQGINAEIIDGTQLGSSGMLYYKLESGNHAAWQKMMLIR